MAGDYNPRAMMNFRQLFSLLRPLPAAALLIAVLAGVPVVSVALNLLAGGTGETWRHLLDTVLGEYAANSLWLALGVGAGVATLGVLLAWLTVLHDFPGRRVFEWALILPLAMPAYVMAYVYTDFLQFVGPVQSALREVFGWQYGDYWFPEVRSRGGAIAMFVAVLYPYVYLLARTAFLDGGGNLAEAARSLGVGGFRAFWRVSLPLARPAVVAGVALALMETLADYGTVAYFAVPTFTTGIYRAWFSLGDRVAAAQLAALLLGFVLLLLALERLSRGRARFQGGGQRSRQSVPRRRLSGSPGLLAALACLLPLLAGFLLPAGLLLRMALGEGDGQFGERFLILARNSFVLAGVSAMLAVLRVAGLRCPFLPPVAGAGGEPGGGAGLRGTRCSDCRRDSDSGDAARSSPRRPVAVVLRC